MKKNVRFTAVFLVLLMLMSVLSVSAVHEDGPCLRHYEGFVGEEGVFLEFIPEESDWYVFYTTGDYDTYAFLSDAYGNEIGYNDDDVDYNFYLKNYLYEGESYYLEVGVYGLEYDEYAWIDTCVEKTEAAVSGTITQLPYNNTVVEGAEDETVDLMGLEAEFTLSDGTVVSWDWYSDPPVGDSYVDVAVSRNEKDEYCVYLYCDDAVLEFTPKVSENPVERIEFTPEQDVFYEGCGGEVNVNGDYIYGIWYNPEDMLTIYYKDGGSYTQRAWDETPEGYYADWFHDQYDNPWSPGDDNVYYVEYLGHTVEVPVSVTESPVDCINVIKDPDVTIYEGYYYPKWEGAEIALIMKDGSVIKETVNEDTLCYRADYTTESMFYTVFVGDYEVDIYYNYDVDLGEYYTLECLGATYDYLGFEFIDGREITDYKISSINFAGENTVIDIEYNLEAETFEFENILVSGDAYDDDFNFIYSWGYVDTQNGIAYYSVEPAEDGGYYLWFLGDYRYAEEDKYLEIYAGLLGDANDDGTVNVRDATVIQKFSAGLISLSDYELLFADADGNGDVNVRDATAIQKYVADIDTGYNIGDEIKIEK